MDGTRWPYVAQDVLRDIAGRLHDAADFVRFHSVCKPWRDSLDAPPPLFRPTSIQFRPWLLAPADKDSSAPIKLRCVFSKSSYRVLRPPRKHVPRRNWISRADGTAVRYMTVEGARHRLHDPINGEDVTHLPRFRWDEGDPHGIVYGDGTVLLYSMCQEGSTAKFRAALLRRPGNAKWTLVERTFENPIYYGNFCVAYHRGNILVTLEHTLWHVITPDVGRESGDVLVPRPLSETLHTHHDSYVLESRGELLWMSVDASVSNSSCHGEGGSRPVQALTVCVYVLEEETSASQKMRWVEKDGRSLADRVFFLGSPNSFAIDASHLGGHGGCAFFIYSSTKALLGDQSGVYRYNLVDSKMEFVDRLPPGWGNEKCTWLVPQPSIAPIQEITKRSIMDIELKQHHTVTGPTRISHLVRHYEPSIRVLVRNLPISVKSSQLQLLFSNHGKVSHTKVIYYERTNVKWPVEAILTITTVYAHREEALNALNGLLLDGRSLKVSLIEEENRRRRHGRVS